MRLAPAPAPGTAHAAWMRLACVAGIAAMIAARIPGIWPHGRLWAEEGMVYLASAWTHPWYRALFTIHTGYLNLPAGGMTTLAVHLVPLRAVPLVTVLGALLIQLAPPVLLATSDIAWLRDWRVLALALLLTVIPPLAEEVWLNTITSQFHITLALAVILASAPDRGRAAWLRNAILLLAPLCGPGAAMLLPLFLLRAWLDRSPGRLTQALLLLPGVLIQAAVVLTHPEPARMAEVHPSLILAAITGKQVLLPLLGPQVANWLMQGPIAALSHGHRPLLSVIAAPVVFGTLGVAAWRTRDGTTRWLFAAAMVVLLVSYAAALTPNGPLDLVRIGFGCRYYFVPAVLTGLTLLGIACTGPQRQRLLGRIAVGWLLLIGLCWYPFPEHMMAVGPDWPAQVAQWRADPARPLAIWPSGWAVRLPARTR